MISANELVQLYYPLFNIMNALIKPLIAALMLAAMAGVALEASAAEVRAGISTRETYVGMPVTFQVQVANATDFEPPTVPEIAGLRIGSVGQPSRSTQTTIINGSTSTRSSITYSFSVTPTQPGNFRIPAIDVRADGQTQSTRPFEFVASKSETGDLLFVEVAGKEKQIYVGQSLDLVLKIWVRPYREQEHDITLSEADMWQLLAERTNWGPFAERIEQLASNRERPVGTEVLRKDRDGANHSYYLYEIDATIYPKKPGRIDASDVQVIVLYPTALGQSRDPFGGMFEDLGFPGRDDNMFGGSIFGPRLTIESVRPIVAEAKVEPIEVLEIPVAGRPADYRGAVGKYHIVAQAQPTDVKAGDPITLLLGIAGTGPMDLVQAPPLAELPALTKDFKVPNEPLAGYVEGARKVFSITIRPRKEGIAEIPPIPFTYFDPNVGKFVTAQSEPISIHVAPADTLALDAVVGRSKTAASANGARAADVPAAGPVLTNFTGDDLLAHQSTPETISRPLLFVVALPPMIVFGLLLFRGRGCVALTAGRFRSASRRCQAEIETATQPAEIGSALRRFLSNRFGLAILGDASAIVGSLRTAGYRNLAVRCERVLQQCDEHGRPGFNTGPSLNELKQTALQMIHDLETELRRPRPKVRRVAREARRFGTTPVKTALIAAALVTFASVTQAAELKTAPLTPSQQSILLAEATERYAGALSTAGGDSAESKQAFADAAQKYQLLVDSGISNGRLYFNLANAYLESGATGRAIANYRRALTLDPTDRAARTNLAFAELAIPSTASTAHHNDKSFVEYVATANDWLNRYVSPRVVLATAILAWFALWGTITLRLISIRFPGKTMAAAALLLAVGAATSYSMSCSASAGNEAVVVSSTAALRAGDGADFPAVGIQLCEGQSVKWLNQRSGWVRIQTDEGRSGWLPKESIEIL